MTTQVLYEPCANTSNGINILRNGEPVWSSCDEDERDVTKGVYTNKAKWNDALLLCKALSLLDEADHAERHADSEHPDWKTPKMPKNRGWATPCGFVDFREPVTYEQACEVAQKLYESAKQKAKL